MNSVRGGQFVSTSLSNGRGVNVFLFVELEEVA